MGKLVRGCLASLPVLFASIAGDPAPAQDGGEGKRIFREKAQPPCALCHTLKAANSTGKIGPDLDELKLDLEKIRKAVRDGVGNMPPYADTLSDAEIEAVSKYVADAVGIRQ
jgi:mono/diheme cytochrome c family protein